MGAVNTADSIARLLKPIEAFSTLSDSELAQVASAARYHSMPAQQEIIGHMDLSASVYFVVAGTVRINILAASGRQITYQLLSAGQMFGELAAIDGLPRSAAVIAETECALIELPQKQFISLVGSNSDFALAIMNRVAALSRWLTARLFEYHAYNVKGRVIAELVRLTGDGNSQVKVSDRDMASRVGTTRENVTRIVGELKNLNIVERSASGLTVLDIERLKLLLTECEFA